MAAGAAGETTMTTTPGAPSPEYTPSLGPGARYVGWFLLAHFALVCGVKIAAGRAGDIAWMSHVGLLMAALGLLGRSSLLIAAALINVLALHGLWLADCLTWLATGRFPLGITNYLPHADAWTWLSTLHHFYLAPLLLVVTYRTGERRPEALLLAIAVYLALTLFSHAALPVAANINYAFRVPVAHGVWLVDWGNQQPGAIYLPGLNLFVALVMFTPAYLLMRNWRPPPRAAHETGRSTAATAAGAPMNSVRR